MRTTYTPKDLSSFEEKVAQSFSSKVIRAPVHLSGGNEKELIHIFNEHVDKQDWVLSTWRSHYHCLLKGVPENILFDAILDGKSISLCFPEYKILSSGIVGGTAPIAVGIAVGIKRKQENRKVICFIGDMAAETGAFYEAVKYAVNFDLPVLFIIEDNGLSVSTETAKAWGGIDLLGRKYSKVMSYTYKMTRPHVGIGEYVAF